MKTEYYRHRPHIQPAGTTLFVTFRLYGSLPKQIIVELEKDYIYLKNLAAKQVKPEIKKTLNKEIYILQKKLFKKYDDNLHHCKTGPTFLKIENIAKIVQNSMHFYDSLKYDLLAFCIMSNHVHIVFKPLPINEEYNSLESIMHSIKSYSANMCNKLLNRRGQKFWVHESYDHYSREDNETERIINYVLNNPVKAGLVKKPKDWKWNYCKHW